MAFSVHIFSLGDVRTSWLINHDVLNGVFRSQRGPCDHLVGFPFLVSEVFCFVFLAEITQRIRADLPVVTRLRAW